MKGLIMEVKELPKQFSTSDGRKFEDKEEATRHQELITAREKYDLARRIFNKLLAETQLTADGERFQFGVFRTYYYVEPDHWRLPGLSEVPYLGWDWDLDDRDGFVIRFRDNARKETHEFPISKLYVSRAAADKALLEAQESWIAEYLEKIKSERVRLYPAATKPGSARDSLLAIRFSEAL